MTRLLNLSASVVERGVGGGGSTFMIPKVGPRRVIDRIGYFMPRATD